MRVKYEIPDKVRIKINLDVSKLMNLDFPKIEEEVRYLKTIYFEIKSKLDKDILFLYRYLVILLIMRDYVLQLLDEVNKYKKQLADLKVHLKTLKNAQSIADTKDLIFQIKESLDIIEKKTKEFKKYPVLAIEIQLSLRNFCAIRRLEL